MTEQMVERCRDILIDHIIDAGMGYAIGALLFGIILYVVFKTRTTEKNRKKVIRILAACCLYCVAMGLTKVSFATYDLCTGSFVWVENATIERNLATSSNYSDRILLVETKDGSPNVRLYDSELMPNTSEKLDCSLVYADSSSILLYLEIHS